MQCRCQAGDDAADHRNAEAEQEAFRTENEGQTIREGIDRDDEQTDRQQGEQCPDDTQGHGLGQELGEHEAALGAERLLHPDQWGALLDGDEHDVGHREAADEDGERPDEPHAVFHAAEKDVDEGGQHLDLVHGEIRLVPRVKPAQWSVGRNDLPLQGLEVHPFLGPDEDARLERLEIHQLAGKGHGHEDEVIGAFPHHGGALLGKNADHAQLSSLQHAGLAQRVLTRKKPVDDLPAQDDGRGAGLHLPRGEEPPIFDVQFDGVKVIQGHGRDTGSGKAAAPPFEGAHVARLEGHGPGRRQAVAQQLGILEGRILADGIFPPRIVRREGPGHFLHEQHVAAHGAEDAFEVLLQGIGDREDRRDHEDADHHAEQGQEGPEPVCHQRLPSLDETLCEQPAGHVC